MARPSSDEASTGVRRFLAALARDSPRRLAWVVFIQLAAAVSQGVGLLLLVPLLQVAGVSKSTACSRVT